MKYTYIINVFMVVVFCYGCTQPSKDKPIEVKEGYQEINGSSVYYKTMGTGEPLIIVHGGPVLDHSYLLPQMSELAKDFKLIFYDQRACGKSSLVDIDTATMSVAGFVEDIELLRKALNLEKVNLLGHSWGGFLATRYAIKYPQNLKTLILSNSLPPNSDDWRQEEMKLSERITTEDSLKRVDIMTSEEMQNNPSSAIKKLMLLAFSTQFKNKSLIDSLHLYIPADFQQRSSMFQYLAPDLASFDLYPDLQKLEIPTLIIYGDYEPAATLSGDKLHAAIPQSKLVIIKNSGHFPYIENPDTYFNSITEFIKNQ